MRKMISSNYKLPARSAFTQRMRVQQTINYKLNRGFTLLVTVLIVAVVLAVALSTYSLVLGELVLSGGAQNSQISFYAAISGLECARYWELKHPGISDSAFATTTSSSNAISCSGVTISPPVGGYASCATPTVTSFADVTDPSKAAVSSPCSQAGESKDGWNIFSIDFPNGSCTNVTVRKITMPGQPYQISIVSQGQNTPCAEQSNRTVQRGVSDLF